MLVEYATFVNAKLRPRDSTDITLRCLEKAFVKESESSLTLFKRYINKK